MRGFEGLAERDYMELDMRTVGGILALGGTILRTSSFEPVREQAIDRLQDLLGGVAQRPQPSGRYHDDRGDLRLVRPIVAWDAGGIKDWLIDGHNGYLVPWKDTTAYAARIDELLTDKTKAREMGRNGLALVSERYDFEDYLDRLEALFGTVAAASLLSGLLYSAFGWVAVNAALALPIALVMAAIGQLMVRRAESRI